MDPLARITDILTGRRIAVLTGAGCSTESGIPDYRGPETEKRARNPIQFNQFRTSADWRQRYWARSVVGWPKVASAQPNDAHLALAELESAGLLTGLITQNVDRLHHAGGSRAVIELHGALADVICLDCGHREDRWALQRRMLELNPSWERVRGSVVIDANPQKDAEMAPDGDAEITDVDGFRVAPCLGCGGDALKPDVVFFGENVPRDRVEQSYQWVDEAEALLVVGSSLTVFSGYRFVKRAHKNGTPVAILNIGRTRGDDLASVKVEERCGFVLPRLVSRLAVEST